MEVRVKLATDQWKLELS